MRAIACFGLAATLAACSPSYELAVDLRTDLVPGEEIDTVHVTLDGAPAPPRTVRIGDDFTVPGRVAEFGGVAPGSHDVRVDLRRRGVTVLSRSVTVRVSASFIVHVVMTRACRGVVCPGEGDPARATECIAGRCVAPDCTTLGPAGCEQRECERDDECRSASPCGVARCWDGVCAVEADASACGADAYCDPDVGCVVRTDPETDGGPAADGGVRLDAGVPAAPLLILSRTPDGPAATRFGVDETVFGRALHLRADATEGCVEIVGSTDGACDTLASWTRLPNADWSYDDASRAWRATFAPFTYPPGSYRLLFRDAATGARSEPVVLTLTPLQPVLVFSSTRDGAPASSFRVSETIHGRALHLRADDTEACVEVVGTTDGYCADLRNWARLPNADWSYDGASAAWRATIAPFAYPPGQYRFVFRDAAFDARSEPLVLTLTPAQPELIFSATRDGPAMTTFPVSATIHGRALHLRADDTEACVEVVGVNDGYCDVLSNWTRLPNADWSYDASAGRWRATIAPNVYPPGSYRFRFRNTTTGEQSAPVVLTLTP